jgi:hypothetical protein
VLVAGTFDAAEARRGGGGGGFRGGGHSFAARSFSSGRTFAPSRFVGRSNFVSAGAFRHRRFGLGHFRFPVRHGAQLGFRYR